MATDSLNLGLQKPGNLQERWSVMWRRLNLPEPEPQVFWDLCDRYTEPHRAYHTLQHLGECFKWFDRAYDLAENPAAVELALWFHDAVYDTRGADNEARSAELAAQVIESVGGGCLLQQSVQTMILVTQHEAAPSTIDMSFVVDIDLAILGVGVDRFTQYEAQIRQEYDWVPEDRFRQKRAEILQSLLNRPSIFTAEFFRERLECQAQSNLHRSLTMLREGLG
ncbi:MAG: hypothetical protein KME14_19545 [Tildeniella torsiva UHER 1998/13D]|jgi:predicted metal-dependent HD superfamily phosphohydrolase|nr:hypothetical protein [Tildeniella torsiva UHER 1998/13D]